MKTINPGVSDTHWDALVHSAIDTHCHGVGRFDFTEIDNIDLDEIEAILAKRQQQTVLTMYLPKQMFNDFFVLMHDLHQGKQAGKYQHIIGVGLEGPLLASHGGTPKNSVWQPSKREWQRIAQCGKQGLVYVIFSPDASFDAAGSASPDAPPTHVAWLAETLLDSGVMPAAGHFKHDDPVASARSLQLIYDVVASQGRGATMTDHLYNDMPHAFKHAWRTNAERQHLSADLAAINLSSWSLDNLDEKLGPIPATMIRNAQRGIVKIAQNFDGEHVDLHIAKRTVELVGAENMMMMTDSIESQRLGGEVLHQQAGSSLLYQKDNIVAAGSQGIECQLRHMFEMGLSLPEIQSLAYGTFTGLLKQHQQQQAVA